jgi:hypothetical protein
MATMQTDSKKPQKPKIAMMKTGGKRPKKVAKYKIAAMSTGGRRPKKVRRSASPNVDEAGK